MNLQKDPQPGMYKKFNVSRVDGRDEPGERHHGCSYFVLDLSHDPFAIEAIRVYAEECESEYPELAHDLRAFISPEDKPLIEYARKELERAGMFDADADYGAGFVARNVLSLLGALSRQGNSGGSHEYTLHIFNKLARYEPLSPITSDPEEWMDVSEASGGNSMWQNRRKHTSFSRDGGKTWYDIEDEASIIADQKRFAEPAPADTREREEQP